MRKLKWWRPSIPGTHTAYVAAGRSEMECSRRWGKEAVGGGGSHFRVLGHGRICTFSSGRLRNHWTVCVWMKDVI